MASAMFILRLIGKVALLAASVLALMLALVDLPNGPIPEAVPQELKKPIEQAPPTETAQCLEYQGL